MIKKLSFVSINISKLEFIWEIKPIRMRLRLRLASRDLSRKFVSPSDFFLFAIRISKPF